MLYISSVDLSNTNGPGVNEIQFVSAAAKVYGQRARFIIPTPENGIPENLPKSQMILLGRFTRRSPISWIRHQRAKYFSVKEEIKRRKPDYIVMRIGVFPVAEWLISFSGLPYFIKTCGNGRFDVFNKNWFFRLIKPIHMFFFRRLIRGSKKIDVVSDIHRADLVMLDSDLASKIIVIDNAVDTDIFSPEERSLKKELGLERYKYLAGYVGNLAMERGAKELLLSWKYISHREELGIIIVSGDKKNNSDIISLARELGISDRVHLFGPVPVTEVPRYMSMLDVGVSFRDDDGCSELKVRQYIACGVPVVVSAKVNQFVESEKLGFLVDRHKTPEIGSHISQILKGEMVADRATLRNYALRSLSYEANMEARKELWDDSVSQR